MNKKTRERIVKKAAEKLKARRREVGAEPKPELEAKGVKEVKPNFEGAMPPLPKMPSAKRVRKPRPTHPCVCGCGTLTAGIWAPGHDARAHGWALRVERNICKLSEVPENEREGARFVLNQRKDGKGGESKSGVATNLKLVAAGPKEVNG